MKFLIAVIIIGILAGPAISQEVQEGDEYEPGMGLLEIFKAGSPDKIPDISSVLTVPWMHELACKAPESGTNIWLVREGYPDAFLVPECAYGFGARPGSEYSFPYTAQITFYYYAREPGKYTFTVWHGRNNFTLSVGDFLIANLSPDRPSAQGICEFKKGFYRAVLWLVSNIYSGESKNDPYFEVKVLVPSASAAVPLTRNALFMKPSDLPGPWGHRGHR
ncbi:MAG: hypothetical protein NTV07_04970 [Candidatus Omnitrophica bacterium]|nr:hypothetical protein [Candidatus Omnitrophota bacterium]